ncbi:hypothetical protein LIT13_06710 [Flavobacterium psychrophilum]|uniref:hypothetical protein n=1 Tax=Flavobacterium phage Fpv7 TaxID=1814287 RepID=UPI00078B46BB|nr:hypothetical protein [Flavobacterium psychrophilum]YP_009321263.1 hypothetical protein BOW77_gp58 [Flavobacterium phage Fpv7]YP_009322329.1 hypothetical protein BOW76_gp58 [Flavobacterium phage Fpv8]YP_009322435.1 hypothetical protein BOW79_gp58 [Flavobacterium phage Fpv5]YP_009323729.1 hypothetical protein BOW72_gp58 [Flavobacterium phage Fpv10]YP_009324581.1 hypothetical protein BOW78_gp58 [Flavobacterium phage Fpv6]YP_009325269.1 hypothetical protein BOW83_gp58 [Flavobacterium phage Fpv
MKKIQANNYEIAFKEIEAIDKEVANALPKEINESDRGHYVVALVKKTDNPVKKTYETTINIQQFDARGFEKTSKSIAILGFDKMVVLHNPETVEVAAIAPTITAAPIKTQVEIDAEIEEKANAKAQELFDAKLKELEASKPAPTTPAANDPKTVDLTELKIDELKAFAKTNEIDIKGLTAKEEIFIALSEWQKDNK